jgi:hypothetical protein
MRESPNRNVVSMDSRYTERDAAHMPKRRREYVDRTVPSRDVEEGLWKCSRKDCDYTVPSVGQPDPHALHPFDPMKPVKARRRRTR